MANLKDRTRLTDLLKKNLKGKYSEISIMTIPWKGKIKNGEKNKNNNFSIGNFVNCIRVNNGICLLFYRLFKIRQRGVF